MYRKFVAKTRKGDYNAVSPDMKLEVIIQRSKMFAAGMINQTRETACVKEWELFCHEILSVINVFWNIYDSGLSFGETNLHHKVGGPLDKVLNERVNKSHAPVLQRGIPI